MAPPLTRYLRTKRSRLILLTAITGLTLTQIPNLHSYLPDPSPHLDTMIAQLSTILSLLHTTLSSHPILFLGGGGLTLGGLYLKYKRRHQPLKNTITFAPKTPSALQHPIEKRIRFITHSQPHYINDRVTQMYHELGDRESNIPLWIHYTQVPLAHSWHLDRTKALHTLAIHGEQDLVDTYLTNLTEELEMLSKATTLSPRNPSSNLIQYLTITENTNTNTYPESVTRALPHSKRSTSSFTLPSLLGSLVAVVIALIYLIRRRSEDAFEIPRQQALDRAQDALRTISNESQKLAGETHTPHGRRFTFTTHQVTVNHQGHVIAIHPVNAHG